MQEQELNSLLEQYDIEASSTRKIRGAVLCDTDRGLFLLKEVNVLESKIPAFFELYEYLHSQGETVDHPLKNKAGEYVSLSEDGGMYMMKHWFSGRECDIRKAGELLKAAGNLAKLHLLMRREMENPVPEPPCLKDEYRRHNRGMKKIRKFVRGVSPKGEFEFAFLKCFDRMYGWAVAAQELLDHSEYDSLYAKSVDAGCMTHGEYNYHNILVMPGKFQPMAAVNFEKFRQGIQVEDLYYFLRKVLEKQGWKERLGDNMLNAYSAIRPISDAEMEYLKLRLVYPEKFWKIADSYYRSNKAWISAKSIEKISTAIRQTEEKERFLSNIFSFHL